jgi:Ca-activated chloride channel family protein
MNGFPIAKAKETMRLALDALYPQDTFNLITFAGDTQILFPEPVPATPENLRRAQAFLASREGRGGTEMMKAIRAALDPSDASNHIRIVCFMTDGYVGNDFEIIGEVQRHPNARVFSFGIGGSVNRFLLDKMAEAGRGEVEYVALNDDGSAAARRFHERVRNPLLTDIEINWGGLPVADIYPKRIPDLFSAKPVVVTGRYNAAANGVVRLSGKLAGRYFTREIPIELPDSNRDHDVLATLWARARVDDLMRADFAGLQRGQPKTEIREVITQLGLDFRLMTQFTSFVAVEEMIITEGGKPRRVEVPVEMPEGVSHDGVFGDGTRVDSLSQLKMSVSGGVSGYGRGRVGKPAPPQSTPVPSVTETVVVTKSAPSRADAKFVKLHPSLVAVVERLEKKQMKPALAEAQFVRDGKAELQIWLTEKTPEVMAQLKRLGLEVLLEAPNGNLVIGRLPVEKLAALAELRFVSYAAPNTRK